MKIKFDEASHTYTHVDTGAPFISVTTLLGKYKQPFDRYGHSKRVAKREGVSQELVLEMWEEEKNRKESKYSCFLSTGFTVFAAHELSKCEFVAKTHNACHEFARKCHLKSKT